VGCVHACVYVCARMRACVCAHWERSNAAQSIAKHLCNIHCIWAKGCCIYLFIHLFIYAKGHHSRAMVLHFTAYN